MSCAMLLDMAVEAFPNRTALTSGSYSLTYRELQSAAYRAAERLRTRGCHHAALLDTNGLAAPVLLFGAAYAGVPYVPLSYRLTGPELEELLGRLVSALLVTAAEHVGVRRIPTGVEVLDRQEFLADVSAVGPSRCGAGHPDPDPARAAIQLFTSGTTGKPKAAILRHQNLLSYILGAVEFGSAAETEATLIAVPPYHVAGIAAVLSSTYAGRRMVMLPAFDAVQWLRTCTAERITHAFLVPTMLARIIDQLSGAEARGSVLRAIAYGGGRMPRTVIERALRLLPAVDFTNAYGLTETSSTLCLLTPGEHRAALESRDPYVQRRLGSVGRPLPGIELQVRDQAGSELGPDQPGVVFVRGGQVAGEYRDSGSALDIHGWFCTRDFGWMDREGYVFLDGRADDIIVRGGENISPGEIETVLLAHPAVSDAVAVAVPSDEWGEAVGAAVVVKEGCAVGAAELQQWVRERLRSSRVPERIAFRERLPYNEMGKVLRCNVRVELSAAVCDMR